MRAIYPFFALVFVFSVFTSCKKEKNTDNTPTPTPPNLIEIVEGDWSIEKIEMQGFIQGTDSIEIFGEGKNYGGNLSINTNSNSISSTLQFDLSFYQFNNQGNRIELGDVSYLDFLKEGVFSEMNNESFVLEAFGFIQTVEVLSFSSSKMEWVLTDSQAEDDFQLTYTLTLRK